MTMPIAPERSVKSSPEAATRIPSQMRLLLPGIAVMLALASDIPAAARPNIIVFLVDDYDKEETSVYGGKMLTPNLERLASEGITFDNAHVTSTVCTPSRYTFLTGRYAGSSYHKEYRELFPPGQQALPAFNVGLEPDNMNIGAALAENGYATGFVGKFHVGPSLSDPAFRNKYGLHDVQKNTPFTEKLNRQQFENEKNFRRAVRDYGFTWAKNIYWDNTKAPLPEPQSGMDRGRRRGIHPGAPGPAVLFTLLHHAAARAQWLVAQVAIAPRKSPARESSRST